MTPQFVLVHSPLVGPSTWEAVADALRQRGYDALVPALDAGEPEAGPYWRLQAASVARALAGLPAERSLLLVGHSGAGALLPAVRELAGRPVAGYLFVDAGVPHDGESRLGRPGDSEFERQIRPHLQAGGRYPEWDEAVLAPLVPDEERRRQLLAELHPRPLAFWEEPIPVFDGWPDAPGGFLLFSPPYQEAAQQAAALGWPVRTLDAGHFHMLVEPEAVASALLELAGALYPPIPLSPNSGGKGGNPLCDGVGWSG